MQDGDPEGSYNRIARNPASMGAEWSESALEGLRGALLLTPPGRALEASQLLMALREMADQRLIQESGEILGLSLDTPMNIHVSSIHAWMRMHGTTIFSPLNIPSSGAGRDSALAAIAQTERNEPGLFNKMLRGDQGAKEKFQRAVDQAVANPQQQLPAERVPTPQGSVRVTARCTPIRICFWPDAKYRNRPGLRREYERQLQLQKDALNRMSPGTIVGNRDAFCDPFQRPALEAQAATARTATRTAYSRLVRQRMMTEARAIPNARVRLAAMAAVPARVALHMRGVAALHNPDQIAGGGPGIGLGGMQGALTGGRVPQIGDRSINSSIGSSWGTCGSRGSRSSRLRDHAERQAAAGCASVQADLDICQD